jgi:hypothetical protein
MTERDPTPEEATEINETALALRLAELRLGGSLSDALPPAILARAIVRIFHLLRPVWQNDPVFKEKWGAILHGLYLPAVKTPGAWRWVADRDNLEALEALEELLLRHSRGTFGFGPDGGEVLG